MSSSRGDLGRLRDRHKQWLRPESDALNPSSSTETESGSFDQQLPVKTILAGDQERSLRPSASNDTQWAQTYVPADYTSRIRRRSLRDQIVESIINRRIEPAVSIEVHLPAVPPSEWARLDSRFSKLWLPMPSVMIAWIVRLVLSVFLLFLSLTSTGTQHGNHTRRFKMRMDQYIGLVPNVFSGKHHSLKAAFESHM